MKDELVFNSQVAIWKQDDKAIVWCKSIDAWDKIKRWECASVYATTFYDDGVIERAYSIPLKKYRFALKAFGLYIKKKSLSPKQKATLTKHRRLFKAQKREEDFTAFCPGDAINGLLRVLPMGGLGHEAM